MNRLYDLVLREHFETRRQMLFFSGPRQIGKTTIARSAEGRKGGFHYFNWDDSSCKRLILQGTNAIAGVCGLDSLHEALPLLVFDEIHKFRYWKIFLKGLFDRYEKQCRLIATGSARMVIYRKGGDSLMGRYLPFQVHPLSLREITEPSLPEREIRPPVLSTRETLEALNRFGGFPEPFLKANDRFVRQWRALRRQQLFREDIRDATSLREIGQMELLALHLQEQAGQLINYSSLAKHIQVSVDTIRRWCEVLDSFYFCFFLRPWSRNVTRSLRKEPKAYLWDWGLVEDPGRRWENLTASHLLKAVHFWNDSGLASCSLHFLRDKDKREVDFLVVRNRKPWFLVEVKTSPSEPLSPSLAHFQKQTSASHAFQVVPEMNYVEADCFQHKNPVKVPLPTFLSQLI